MTAARSVCTLCSRWSVSIAPCMYLPMSCSSSMGPCLVVQASQALRYLRTKASGGGVVPEVRYSVHLRPTHIHCLLLTRLRAPLSCINTQASHYVHLQLARTHNYIFIYLFIYVYRSQIQRASVGREVVLLRHRGRGPHACTPCLISSRTMLGIPATTH